MELKVYLYLDTKNLYLKRILNILRVISVTILLVMTFTQLQYFYVAATLEHFNQAAHTLHVSEPSLSRSIRLLEEELGIRLFEKKGRNISLTKAGRVFLVHVERIKEDINRAINDMNEYAINGGRINIAYVSPVSSELLPDLIHNFLQQEENKRVNFEFHEGYTQDNYEGLKSGKYDLIFGTNMQKEPGINMIPVFETGMVVLIPNNHPLKDAETIDHTAFTQYPVLKYDKESTLGQYTDQYFSAYNVVPDVTLEFPDEQSIASFVSKGFGIALAADIPCVHRENVIVKRMKKAEQLKQEVSLAYLDTQNHSPSIVRLIQFIAKHYKK